ncbi:hypothetical protein [Bradyrhizobium retamae]|uniref:Uncharacterized protein n=1 Tax=Bradyrhizobium retamae TaxID=1300035 RepID=A0A0R3MU62_9BRAD|nr:hypothetical protein [Bradyrhizobium retamae]KRR23591.1 hypothetical protein CQ13_06060 [Bradyrhizobium retamae]
MNSTPTPKETEPQDALNARADERLVQAHEQIKRADEQLALLTEQLEKMERDTAHPPSSRPAPQSPEKRPALRTLAALPLAACIIVAALVLQSSYSGGAKQVVAWWAPQPVSTPSLPPEDPPSPAQPAPSTVEVAAAEAAPPQASPPQVSPPQASTLAQAAPPQDASPPTTAAPPEQTQLLQTIARDLANLERTIEQLKANQQQMASDNSKAITELKASQEEMKRALAKVSEQNPPKASAPPTRPAPTLRKPERPPPQARSRPRYPREWIYDDYDW